VFAEPHEDRPPGPEALTSSSAAAVVPPVAWITRENFTGPGVSKRAYVGLYK